MQLFLDNGEYLLYNLLKQQIYLKKFSKFKVELSLTETIPSNFIQRIKDKVKEWTAEDWQVIVGEKTKDSTRIIDIEQQALEDEKAEFQKGQIYQSLIKHFPDIEIVEFKKR